MEEQCSVHSTHWGTLKFTVIFSDTLHKPTHTYCQEEAGAYNGLSGQEQKPRKGLKRFTER